jgi:hypothetical protein
MSLLKAFGQRKLQPFLMRLAMDKRIQGIVGGFSRWSLLRTAGNARCSATAKPPV